jgi:hypothetical protein
VRELAGEGTGWPPSLPEFAAVCQRHHDRPGRNVLSLPAPKRTADELNLGRGRMEHLLSMIGRPKTGDPLAWAHRAIARFERGEVPASVHQAAVEALRNVGRETEGAA